MGKRRSVVAGWDPTYVNPDTSTGRPKGVQTVSDMRASLTYDILGDGVFAAKGIPTITGSPTDIVTISPFMAAIVSSAGGYYTPSITADENVTINLLNVGVVKIYVQQKDYETDNTAIDSEVVFGVVYGATAIPAGALLLFTSNLSGQTSTSLMTFTPAFKYTGQASGAIRVPSFDDLENITLIQSGTRGLVIDGDDAGEYIFDSLHGTWLNEAENNLPAKFVNDATGNDAYSGSYSRPWKTIQHAVDNVTAGDTIYVLDGTYNERVVISQSGTISAPITLMALPGHSPVIDGAGLTWGSTTWGGLVSINRNDNWIFDGLSLINSVAMGFGEAYSESATGSFNIIVRNCSTTDTGCSGVFFKTADTILIDNVSILRPNISLGQEGISLDNVENFEVKNCTVLEPRKEGIDAKNGCRNGSIHGCTVKKTTTTSYGGPGFYIDAFSRHQFNIELYENTAVMPEGAGFSTGCESHGILENILFRNNVVYDSLRGYNIASNGTAPYTIKDITIRNNVAFNSGFSGVYIPSAVTNALIENNILYPGASYTSSGVFIYDLGVTDINQVRIRNNFFRAVNLVNPNIPPGTNYLSNSNYDLVMVDPTGTLTGTRDFHLAASSAAIAAGHGARDMGRYDEYMQGVDIVTRQELDTLDRLKAPLASPALTGTPTTPTATAGTNTTQIASTAFVKTSVDNLIAAAPGALDTLDELAAALGDDANYAATVTTALAGKQPLDSTLTSLAAYNTNGLLAQTAADTFVGRVLTGTTNQVTVTNGDGVAGNPTLSLPQNIHTGASPSFLGLTLDTNTFFLDSTNHRIGFLTTAPTHSLTFGSTSTGMALYNTVDQVTNFDRLRVYVSGNVFNIASEFGGTGSVRDLSIKNDSGNSITLGAGQPSAGMVSIARATLTSATSGILGLATTFAATSGVQYGLKSAPTINQTSTAGYDAILADVTETATGSGAKSLLNLKVGGVSKFRVTNLGQLNLLAATTAAASANIATGVAPTSPATGDVYSDGTHVYCYLAATWKQLD